MANWTQSKVNKLISCYEEHPCLYDTTLKEYFNRDKRSKALQEIATALGYSGTAILTL